MTPLGHRYPPRAGNALAGQTSPYLLAHARDPVDWLPWSDEAFDRARAEGKPVFLSIGYESCHWCHVMQRESFQDEGIAALLNERFVSVKVDREERPDVDALYMDYVAGATGHGGWPMSVFLTADRIPVFGGTYFPRAARQGLPSFDAVLTDVAHAFAAAPADVEEAASAAMEFLHGYERGSLGEPFTRATIAEAAARILASADEVHGGFGDAPKFPQVPLLRFLFAFSRAGGDGEAAAVAHAAVLAMIRGGIFDQAGGGLFRYATDAGWTVPHFEKMLYDQAMLLSALADAQGARGSEELARCVRLTAGFLRRELARSDGLLCSALSAETEGVEGATYVWTYDELASFLDPSELAVAERALGVTRRGHLAGANVLTRRPSGVEDGTVDRVLDRILARRERRPRPERDGKVIVSWNALAARGLMEAGAAFGDEALMAEGRTLLDALLGACCRGDEVVHVLDDPAVEGVRLLEDYAHLVAACLTAHELGIAPLHGEATLLARAKALHSATLERFSEGPILYVTAPGGDLPVRPHEQHDTPLPSGASTAVENAARLGQATGDPAHRDFAERAVRQFSAVAHISPSSAGTALTAALRLTGGPA